MISAWKAWSEDGRELSQIDTGSLRGDLMGVVRYLAAEDPDKETFASVPPAIARDEGLMEVVREVLIHPAMRDLARMFERAVDRGEIAAGNPVIALADQILLGPWVAHGILYGTPATQELMENIVDTVLLLPGLHQSGERGAPAFSDVAQLLPVDLGVRTGQRVDGRRGEQRDHHRPGSRRAETHLTPFRRPYPQQVAHVVEVDPPHAQPGGGLIRPERRFVGEPLREALAAADRRHLVGVDQHGFRVRRQVGQQPAGDEPAHREGTHDRRFAGHVRCAQGPGDPVRGRCGGNRFVGERGPDRVCVHRLHSGPRPLVGGSVRSRDEAGVPRPPEGGDRHSETSGGLAFVVLGASGHGGSSSLAVRPERMNKTVT
ncbi:TetR-like C-terminal domain-containing protein [Streptomyces eurythermus]|uniref:TetR-like C-terminal domain-containing protein n=1 Tax=Streptomyces eurythermus TaxID=42237 RepID=UPI0036D39C4C